ncbi:hypothetical protein HXX76_005283 [Chlamydomonas incerta]|uniref:Uncharacterized protein n=1 Tax=Chlamydomonas incerta TaxID=51695 RepID=A0A835T968_CHLIN|nr:hypothetical protein HXX76_005283 [Chlamydomonas incerta]|eukprot:KAG2438738.1 hypothetical protein HXX76_005283 [Chlamydomonas incerta]
MELQQRRFAGAKVDIPQVAQQPAAGLPALSGQPQIVAPSAVPNGGLAASRSGNVSTSSAAYEQAGSHAMGQVNPNAYLKTLNTDAAAAMSQYNTRPLPATPGGIASLSISTPASPLTARLATPSEATARNSDFARLEAMHDKYMGRTKSQHEQGIAARINEVSSWQQTFAACMAALAQHQSGALSHLASCVEEAEAWHAQQRGAVGAAHDEVMTEAERLSRQLEAAQTAAAAKLNGLLASFLERVLPSGEVGLAEAQAAYTRSAANLRNEHVAALEAAEAALRALIPRHAAMRQHMSASYSSGLAAHEAALAAAGGHYDSRGIPELRRQYEDAESRHRDALATIRVEHLKGLASSRDGWMGEAAALLEEYRARMQELKQQYMLAYEVNITEV